jgi:phosphopantetheinyl transferase
MPIGEFIQNLLAALERRLENYKEKYDFNEIRSDKVDAKLIKFMMISDAKGYSPDEITLKLEQIKKEFESSRFKPQITIDNGNL